MEEVEDEWDVVSTASSALTTTSWALVSGGGAGSSLPGASHHEGDAGSQAGSVAVLSDLMGFEMDMPHGEDLAISEDGGSVATAGTSLRPQCPLTLDRMREPTLCLVDGKVYEKAAIEQWVRLNGSSPFTREPVSLGQLRVLPGPRMLLEGDEDEDDAQSISTQNGWPRAQSIGGPAAGGMVAAEQGQANHSMAGSPNSPAAGASYLEALLNGGGGIQGNRAQSLSTAQRTIQRRPQYSAREGNATTSGGSDAAARRKRRQERQDEDITDLVDEEWMARKNRVGRWKGRLMVTRIRRSSAYGGLHIPTPQPNLPTLYEGPDGDEYDQASDQESGYYDAEGDGRGGLVGFED